MEYLEKDLKVLENLTLETNTDENKINIFKLKNAIEKYLCLIFGISDEEYNYHLTNESLSVELKRVIKKVACYPDHIAELEINSCLEIISKGKYTQNDISILSLLEKKKKEEDKIRVLVIAKEITCNKANLILNSDSEMKKQAFSDSFGKRLFQRNL